MPKHSLSVKTAEIVIPDTTGSTALERRALDTLHRAKKIQVRGEKSATAAAEIIRELKRSAAEWEEQHRPGILSAHKHHKQLVSDFNRVSKPLSGAVDALRKKIGDFKLMERRRLQEQAQKRLAESQPSEEAKEQAIQNALHERDTQIQKAEQSGDKERADRLRTMPLSVIPPTVIPPADVATETKITGVSVSENSWTYEIVDIDKIPSEYTKTVVDESKIKETVKIMGSRTSIPGVIVRPQVKVRVS
jgi:hypothetical protein